MTINIVLVLFQFALLLNKGRSDYCSNKNIHLRHSVLFAVCFLIVFFQSDIDFVLGLASEEDYFVYDSRVVCKGMVLSNMSFTGLIAGYRLATLKDYSTISKKTIDNVSYSFQNKKILCHFALFLIILYVLFMPKEYFNSGYGSDIVTSNIAMITGYLVAVLIAIFVVYSIDFKNTNLKSWVRYMKYPLVIIVIYSFLILISGRRTEALRVCFIVLSSYLYCYKEKVNYKLLVIFGIVSMLAFAFVGVYRSLQGGSVNEGLALLDAKSSIIPFTHELSTSVNTLHIALSHYPEQYDFNYGSSFFPGFMKIIPGFYGMYQTVTGIELEGSDLILTKLYFGNGDLLWGVGSSLIADLYISFGVVGCILIFMIFGYFLRRLEIKTFFIKSSPYFLALSFSCYSQFMFACRSTFAIMFLCWTYSCILIYLTKRNGRTV